MGTCIDTFERKEVKYRLAASQSARVIAGLVGRLRPDAYGATRIDSVYWDTPKRDLIARSLEKPLYKEKLRMRTYRSLETADVAFIELKKKFKGIVYKRRVRMSFAGARAYLEGMPFEEAHRRFPAPVLAEEVRTSEAVSTQIAREIDGFRARHALLSSSMLISCERTAFAPIEGGGAEGVRITFDYGICAVDLRARTAAESAPCRSAHASNAPLLKPSADEGAFPLIGEGEAVMEVKCAGSYPLWLVRLLGSCRAYPSSFSKYGEAYRLCDTSLREPGPNGAAVALRVREQPVRRFRASENRAFADSVPIGAFAARPCDERVSPSIERSCCV